MTSIDIVGIFDATSFTQVFSHARPIRAEVLETSKVMQHPVETGVMLADHHIINPMRINIQFMLSSQFYSTDYEQMRNSFINASKLNIQTKTAVYNNIIIADMPHQETPDVFDSIILNVAFQEVIYITPVSVSPAPAPANYSPQNPVNANTVQTGSINSSATNFSASQQNNINAYLQ
jgi:hypothetical protein